MRDEVILKRTFLLRDGDGRNVDVTGVLHRLGGNKEPHFSVTSQRGSAHEDILAAAPADVASDLRLLVAVHCRDGDGVPTHALANGTYFLTSDDYKGAVAALGGTPSVEELVRVKAKATTAWIDVGEGALSARVEAARKAAVRLVDETSKVEASTRAGETLLQFGGRQKDFAVAFDAAWSGTVEDGKLDTVERNRKGRTLLSDPKFVERARECAERGVPAGKVEAWRKAARENILSETLLDLVKARLSDVWMEDAARAKEVLKRPDYRVGGRPLPEDDETTFAGFAKAKDLTFAARRDGTREGGSTLIREGTSWTCDLGRTGADAARTFPFHMGSAYGTKAPDVETVLESLRSDAVSAQDLSEDEFCNDLGYSDGTASTLKRGMAAYAECRKTDAFLKELLGDDGYQAFMTEVGDDPPLTPEHFSRAPAMG